MTILKSASKTAFVLLIATACAGFLMGKLPVEPFMLLATAGTAFYFGQKSNPTASSIQ